MVITRDNPAVIIFVVHCLHLMPPLILIVLSKLDLRIGPACEAGLSADMERERVPPQRRKKESRLDRGIQSATEMFPL